MYSIELIGLPGVGKSTLVKFLAKRINAEIGGQFCFAAEDAFFEASRTSTDKFAKAILNVAPKSLAQFFLQKIQKRTIYQYEKTVDFVINHSNLITTVMNGEEFKKMTDREQHFVVSGMFHTGSLYESIRSNNNKTDNIVLFDEGFLQCALIMGSLKNATFNENDIVDFVENCPKPNLLIHVKSGHDICMDRMSQRAKGITFRLRMVDKENICNALSTIDSILAVIKKSIQSQSITIVEIESQSTIDDTVNVMVDKLRHFIPKPTKAK